MGPAPDLISQISITTKFVYLSYREQDLGEVRAFEGYLTRTTTSLGEVCASADCLSSTTRRHGSRWPSSTTRHRGSRRQLAAADHLDSCRFYSTTHRCHCLGPRRQWLRPSLSAYTAVTTISMQRSRSFLLTIRTGGHAATLRPL